MKLKKFIIFIMLVTYAALSLTACGTPTFNEPKMTAKKVENSKYEKKKFKNDDYSFGVEQSISWD